MRGPWLVFATLALAVVVPVVAIFIFRAVDDPTDDRELGPSLVWAERETWPQNQFTRYKSLERGMMSSARTNEKFKDLGFHVSAGEHASALRLATLARHDAATFASPATREAIDRELAAEPGFFYAHFLRAQWHQLHGDKVATEADRVAAFATAPAALLTQHATSNTAGELTEPLAFAFDQILHDRLDRSLVLVFPFLKSEPDGLIYLPVYKAILRRANPDLPAGVSEIDPQPRWFTFYRRVGRLAAEDHWPLPHRSSNPSSSTALPEGPSSD